MDNVQDVNKHLERLTEGINKLNKLFHEYPELKQYIENLIKKGKNE